MPAQKLSSDKIDALCDKELEILYLLASGHTAKSIANSLGRSETAINERLREARRKTGVGSSRELARILAAQKIWDKNIDLTTARSANDTLEPAPDAGRPRSKGTRLMLYSIAIAAAGLMLFAAGSSDQAEPAQQANAVAAAPSPLEGSWSLDVNRIPADQRPQRVTISFAISPERQWTTQVEIVAPDGAVSHSELTAALDGQPAPISGTMPFIDTVSLRQPAPNTLVMTLGKSGSPVSTRVYTVAKDRQSMTETIIWASAGIPEMQTTYFNRIG